MEINEMVKEYNFINPTKVKRWYLSAHYLKKHPSSIKIFYLSDSPSIVDSSYKDSERVSIIFLT